MLGCVIGLLSGTQRRQHHNNERKGNFSHQRFYHDLEYSQAIIGTPPLVFLPAAPEIPAAAQEWTLQDELVCAHKGG
jgi:hypothetical protein